MSDRHFTYPEHPGKIVTAGELTRADMAEKDARIAELEAENTLLRKQAEDDQASIRMSKQHVKALRQHRDLFKNKSTHLEAEVARLTKALVECQEAFENGVEQ